MRIPGKRYARCRHRYGPPTEDAFRYALGEDHGLTQGDAFSLLGQVLEARCTAIVNPTFTYIAKVAKEFLPAG
jgi:hypothetical protein